MTDQKTSRRVLIFCLTYYPHYVGGAEVAVKEITDRIGQGDIEFHMITLRGEGKRHEKIGNVMVHRVQIPSMWIPNARLRFIVSKYAFPIISVLKSLWLHRKYKYDLIWSIMANYAGFGTLFFKMLHPRLPFLLTLQEGDPIDYIKRRVRFIYPLFRSIFAKADSIQTISHHLAGFAREMGAKKDAVVIPNGVDVAHFSRKATTESVDLLKRNLDKKESDVFLVTTSRLVAKNGVGDIILALTRLPADVSLIVIGTGKLEKDLKRQVKELGLSNRVRFLGFIPHEKLPSYLHVSDVFVRPSLSEGLGNSFLEAMAAGVPVVGTTVGGIADFLRDGETGFVCQPNNPESVASAVRRVMEDKVAASRISDAARQMVEGRYDWNGIASEMKAVLLSARV